VRESERRRFADPTHVDKVVELDQLWREGTPPLHSRSRAAAPAIRHASAARVAVLRAMLRERVACAAACSSVQPGATRIRA
jgi:hypothetical protein